MRIAIVYDWMDSWGGVERLLLTLHEMFPEAEFFTSYYNPQKADWAKGLKVKTSFIQNLPGFIKNNRILSLPLYPYAFESLDFRGYDAVISVTSSFAKGIITRPETFHLCYLLTPTRYLWSHTDQYVKKNPLSSIILEKLRAWDLIAAQRPDKILCLSKAVQNRCRKYYRRDSELLYPPFDIQYWQKVKESSQKINKTEHSVFKSLAHGYYLIVSRLEPYKKVDQAIEVFKEIPDKQLVIVGTGTEEGKLRHKSGPNIRFISRVDDAELAYLYSNAEALIMPQEEDFGYVSLEAQYFGCPVVAYKAGGALETVIEGQSGMLYQAQTVEALKTALEKYHTISYNIKLSLRSSNISPIEKFSVELFKSGIFKQLNKLNNKNSL
jgi:glycosyltransferase involved in cell wall biosynthesis